jgi:hypothetical protein
VERKTTPSESTRLELEMLDDTTDSTRVEPPANTLSGPVRNILVVTTNPNMRLYLEDCLRSIPRALVLDRDSTLPPDLIVYDELSGDRTVPIADDVARLFIVAERPGAGESPELPSSSAPSAFIVTPFDARTVVHAALQLLR